jgi:hypothetical protein
MAIALAATCWAGEIQAQGGPGGCRGGSGGTPTLGTPTIGTPITTTGFVPTYPYYSGGSSTQNYYQQSQLAYQMAMQMEYLRQQQQQAYAKQLEDQAAAVESARLHKVSVRQQRRLELEARRAAAKEKRLALANDRERRSTASGNRSVIGQLAANER